MSSCFRAAVAIMLAAVTIVVQTAFAQDPTPIPVVPVARIISPIPDQVMRGAYTIQGSAVAPGFLRYEVAYAVTATDPVWITIGGAQFPVPNGTLLTWNTRALPDGNYILRLQVFSTDGTFVATVAGLKLSNQAAAGISTPQTTSQRPAAPTEFDTARDALSTITTAITRIPAAFLRGARFAALALAGVVAYAIVKSILLALLQRVTRRPIDYGA